MCFSNTFASLTMPSLVLLYYLFPTHFLETPLQSVDLLQIILPKDTLYGHSVVVGQFLIRMNIILDFITLFRVFNFMWFYLFYVLASITLEFLLFNCSINNL